ncbi:hypothetical protein GCM10010172_09440 [Paractinoplanes ferrugineus]|uniref:Uncharacterized protein n=1 Tax=Paractinoplanes ferrugineus TaxID=113564 RepID=A0A919IWL6_9ACTN|nr:hypothetical protein Afe05nite_13490 [Actinoplanes ferrugineus]
MAVADPTAFGSKRGGREGDTLYRRPPAHPPVDTTTGGSWFTDGTDLPAEEEEVAPDFGPATPRGSGRASFGFSDGPISPKRSAPTSGAPAGSASPTPAYEPAAREWEPVFEPASREREPVFEPASRELEPLLEITARDREPTSYDPDSLTPAELPIRRNDAPSAGRGPAPAMSNWPPPARLTPGEDTLGRVPRANALHAPSGEFANWRSDTGSLGAGVPTGAGVSHSAATEPPRRQSRGVTIAMVVLSAVVLLAGSAVGVVYFSGSNDHIDSVLQLGSSDAGKRTATAPLDNRTKASFELLAGTNSVHVTIGELGDDLYRISTPDDAGILPNPSIRNDDVKLQVSKDGDGTGGEIEIVLAAKVRWALRFSGYAEKQVIDVSGGQISGLEMVAGMRTAQLVLSQPAGTVPVKINGAVDSLVLKSPSGNPVRIKVAGGAQTVVAGSKTLKDVPAGSTLTPKDWNVANRYDMTAGARITSLTVENA